MSLCRFARLLGVSALAWFVAAQSTVGATEPPIRDVTWFLHRLRTVEHLPELEDSHTALASTWDRSGGNADGTDFKCIQGTTNVLLDVSGPGCIHRLFTGASEPAQPDTPGYLRVDGTRLQVYLDAAPTPLFDFPVTNFFDPAKGPVPAPLAGGKAQGWTYPGCLFPIPYAQHCRVQLINPDKKNWGSYWQIAYTTYPAGPRVETLAWPLRPEAKAELDRVCRTWLDAQSAPPVRSSNWTEKRSTSLAPGQELQIRRSGVGVVRELSLMVQPATPEILRGLRLLMFWDDAAEPSVDLPAGYFFGNADSGHEPSARFSTLLLGVTRDEAYTRFPMPYAKGARICLRNGSKVAAQVRLALAIEKLRAVHDNWGRFHAAYLEAPAALPDAPRLGPKQVPCHLVL